MRISTSDFTAKKKGSGSNDIFEKCRNFTRPGDLQSAGLYMYFEVFGDRDGCGPGEVRMGQRKVLMFGSNDYLDLINNPKVKEAAVQALKKYGSGCSGSRLLNGTLDLHVKLEAELVAFVHKEAALIFGTGFQANYATLSALTEKGDVMICDHNLHASLVEGALRSPARTMRFRHNDLDHFERCLENCPPEDKIFIVSEGVFSMEGDIALHAEDAFGNNEDFVLGRAVLQAALKVVQIVMAEPHGAGRRPQRAFHQASVQVVIADHHVAFFREGRKRGVVGLEAGAENEGGFLVHERRQFRFQLHVQVQRAVEQARPAAPAAVFLEGLDRGFLHLGVVDQVQIIVGPEHQHFA